MVEQPETSSNFQGNLNDSLVLISGSTLSVILSMDNTTAIISSAAVAVIYTFFGGMYSVAFTDVIQLFFIVFGLVSLVPLIS